MSDTVVQIITIPCVAEPQGWVLVSRSDEPDLGAEAKKEGIYDANYSVIVECHRNDLTGVDIPAFWVRNKATSIAVGYDVDSFVTRNADGQTADESDEEPIGLTIHDE